MPFSAPGHVHRRRSRQSWHHEAAEELVFYRVTALAFLRHLTNRRVLGKAALDGAAAWRALATWLQGHDAEVAPRLATSGTSFVIDPRLPSVVLGGAP